MILDVESPSKSSLVLYDLNVEDGLGCGEISCIDLADYYFISGSVDEI